MCKGVRLRSGLSSLKIQLCDLLGILVDFTGHDLFAWAKETLESVYIEYLTDIVDSIRKRDSEVMTMKDYRAILTNGLILLFSGSRI